MRQKVTNPPPSLTADWEVEPTPDRYLHHYPLNGVPYKVQDGDNFVNLASKAGMSAKALLEFNFLTDKPQTINWYLRNYTGCTDRSSDSKSYSFRSANHPGIIQFPPQAYKKLIELVTPIPIWEDETWEVPGHVPAMFQGTGDDNNNCWTSSITAMYRYKYSTISTENYMKQLGSTWHAAWKSQEGLGPSDYRTLKSLTGLRELTGKMSTDPFEWVKDLQAHGPILATRSAGGNDTHLVIVHGYRFIHPSEFKLIVMDPAAGRSLEMSGYTMTLAVNNAGPNWIKRLHW